MRTRCRFGEPSEWRVEILDEVVDVDLGAVVLEHVGVAHLVPTLGPGVQVVEALGELGNAGVVAVVVVLVRDDGLEDS